MNEKDTPNLIEQQSSISLPGDPLYVLTTSQKIRNLRNKHAGKAAFCLGTAPHLSQIDLTSLKGQVVIACNQLAGVSHELGFNYLCIQRDIRFQQFRSHLLKEHGPQWVIPDSVYRKNLEWIFANKLESRITTVNSRFTSRGHAEYFSFDLENCVYAGDIIAMQIQLAVWMGCNPIYILGVDAAYQDNKGFYYDDTAPGSGPAQSKHFFPDLRDWLGKVRTLLWARGVKIFDAAGELSSLSAVPKTRLSCALGRPTVAVTSKTFCQDPYLVGELKRYFTSVKVNDSKDKVEGPKLIEFLSDVDAVVLGTEDMNAEVMEKLPCLRYVSKYGVGLNNFDFSAAKRHQIELAYQKGVNSDSVAELTLAFAIMLIRNIDQSIRAYKSGKWSKLPGKELHEMTLGIVGYGHIGKIVARKFAALGIGRLLVSDLLDFPVAAPAEFVNLDYLLNESDIVSMHVSMEERNYYMVDQEFIEKMRDGSYLINTSRGEIVDPVALLKALESGKLAGAALDVYEDEPKPSSVLGACSNLLTTCHIAGSSNRAIKNMGWAAIEGLLRLLKMDPV